MSSKSSSFLVVAWGLATLLTAMAADWVITLMLQNSQNSSGGLANLLVWLFPLCDLAWLAMGVGLVWYLARSSAVHRLAAGLLLLAGLLVILADALIYVTPAFVWAYAYVDYLSPNTFLFHAGGLVAMAGLLGLLLGRQPTPAAAPEPTALEN